MVKVKLQTHGIAAMLARIDAALATIDVSLEPVRQHSHCALARVRCESERELWLLLADREAMDSIRIR